MFEENRNRYLLINEDGESWDQKQLRESIVSVRSESVLSELRETIDRGYTRGGHSVQILVGKSGWPSENPTLAESGLS